MNPSPAPAEITETADSCMSKPIYQVFVYGTLKGMDHGWRGVGNITKVSDAVTVNNYVLYDGGFPKCVDETQHNIECKGRVVGELHTVDGEALAHLDSYEGHPTHFERKIIKVEVDGIGQVDAWMYFGPTTSYMRNPPITPFPDGTVSWPVEAL